MPRNSYLLLILACIALLVTGGAISSLAENTTSSLQDRYKQAKFFYNQLETKEELGNQRTLWLKSCRNFRKVYLSNPKSELAPASLFMLGRIYRRMFEKFEQSLDLNESIGYFRDCYSLFPHHRLADDALFALGDINLTTLSDYETSTHFFSEIISKYPQGDMHSEAATKLKILSSQYNMALPNSMIGDGPHQRKLTNVLPVKYWSSTDYSRVIIKASDPVTYSAQLLEKSKDLPRRLYIDFQDSYIEPRYRSPVPIADGLLQQIRTGQHSQEVVRVVLDIESISSYKIFSLPDPFRVVVDIRGIDRRDSTDKSKSVNTVNNANIEKKRVVIFRQGSKRKHTSSTTKRSAKEKDDQPLLLGQDLSLAQQLGLGVRKIVIDPGHGGKDPGAIANGIKEKDIVLQLAKNLKHTLTNTAGFDVLLTRTDDSYLSLEERTAIANGNNADLFLSLHVNAHPLPSVRGLETYFLSLTTNREAMRVAAFENATSELQMSDLQDVLADIMKNSKIKESSRLAKNVHTTLVNGLADEGRSLKDLGVKQAPFYVLIGAEMPAILLEIAFISNPEEAEKLKSDTFLTSYAEIISKGLSSYIHSNTARLQLPQ